MTSNLIMRSIVGFVLCSGLAMATAAQGAPRLSRAVAVTVKGEAEYHGEGQTDWKPLRRGMALTEGASSRTETNSTTDLWMSPDAYVRVTPTTIIRFDQLRQEIKGLPQEGGRPDVITTIDLERGKLLVQANEPTPGSEFAVTTRGCLREVRGFGA